jgi:ABC-type hemin transport system substrate-binding protein
MKSTAAVRRTRTISVPVLDVVQLGLRDPNALSELRLRDV